MPKEADTQETKLSVCTLSWGPERLVLDIKGSKLSQWLAQICCLLNLSWRLGLSDQLVLEARIFLEYFETNRPARKENTTEVEALPEWRCREALRGAQHRKWLIARCNHWTSVHGRQFWGRWRNWFWENWKIGVISEKPKWPKRKPQECSKIDLATWSWELENLALGKVTRRNHWLALATVLRRCTTIWVASMKSVLFERKDF